MAANNAWLARQLEYPKGRVDAVIDTDTYNEIDDQYALAYGIKSEDKLNILAIYAAPFSNKKCDGPADGMEKSYDEIMKILELMDRQDLKARVYKGSDRYLGDERTPVLSEAARDLVKRAMDHTPENPLYVIALAAITTVASALLIEPKISERIVVVWLGGQAHFWPDNREFNLMQDIAAARVVFSSPVPLVQLPCMGVASTFRVSGLELLHHLKGKNSLCDYLVDVTTKEALKDGGNSCWSRPIWDVTAVAWLAGRRFCSDCLVSRPIPEYDDHYAFDPTNHLMTYVYSIDRDVLFEDLVVKLTR